MIEFEALAVSSISWVRIHVCTVAIDGVSDVVTEVDLSVITA